MAKTNLMRASRTLALACLLFTIAILSGCSTNTDSVGNMVTHQLERQPVFKQVADYFKAMSWQVMIWVLVGTIVVAAVSRVWGAVAQTLTMAEQMGIGDLLNRAIKYLVFFVLVLSVVSLLLFVCITVVVLGLKDVVILFSCSVFVLLYAIPRLARWIAKFSHGRRRQRKTHVAPQDYAIFSVQTPPRESRGQRSL